MKGTLHNFYKAFYRAESNFNEYHKKYVFDFISRPQEMMNVLDYMFYNSTLRILWCTSRRPESLTEKVTEYWDVPVDIQKDNENGIWRYSFEYDKDFYFTIDSKERIIL